jgi:tetratricopeptide (TPR) repeat protein
MKLALVALSLILLGASSASAQSKRYPPVTPDRELEEERRSDLWESTLHPDTRPYKELVRDAKRLIDQNTPDDIKAALDKLDAAIKRLPKVAEAYQLRGQLYMSQQDWAKCADDLGRAEDYSKVDDLAARTKGRIDLANCLARAGRLSEAETTLVRAAASAQTQRGELWMRLGEVRIAMGKLDEAIDALSASLDADSGSALTRWLLMAAYDRARRPSEALEHGQMARRYDGQRTYIDSPVLPLLGIAEGDYLNGLAYRYAIPSPEYALLYFRRYVKLAPDSPWKRRADEHVRELSALRFPSRDTITNTGTAVVDVEVVRKTLELAASAFQISVTRLGARTPETVRDRPIYRLPPAGAKVLSMLHIDSAPKEELDAAMRCIQTQADKLQLPAPKERDTYYVLSFLVVSP